MPPLLIALVQVVLLFIIFASTRRMPSKGKKWGVRAAAFVVLFFVLPPLVQSPGSSDATEIARETAVSTEYAIYFGIVAAIIYWIFLRRRV